MRVALITTGKLELWGLPAVLDHLFPGHVFEALERLPGEPFHGFTSKPVKPLEATDDAGEASSLVRQALGALVPEDLQSSAADLAVILDDLELANTGNEGVVIEHMRASALRVLREPGPDLDPAKRAMLRTRVSFHLAVPMPEAWFFGDLEALPALIAPEYADVIPPERMTTVVRPGPDPERFRAIDEAYLKDDGAACRQATSGPKPRVAPWLINRRDEHPKRYVEWLLRDPQAGRCHRYREAEDGVRVLHRLAWSKVLAEPAAFTWLRAMVRDLEAALQTAAVGVPPGGVEAELTSVLSRRADPLFRNL
jgi:hypothetical protein